MTETTSATWTDEGTFVGGTSFGDDQAGDDVSRRFTRRNDDGTWTVLDVTFAAMATGVGADEVLTFYVDERTDIITCTDPTDPGSSEISSDVEYGEGSALSYAKPDDAHAEAVRLARTVRADYL